jgi:hypothetical protein
VLNYITRHSNAKENQVANFLVIERVEDPISENLPIESYLYLTSNALTQNTTFSVFNSSSFENKFWNFLVKKSANCSILFTYEK